MPRRPKTHERTRLSRALREHDAREGRLWKISDAIVPEGPNMADLARQTLRLSSDSAQREAAKKLAAQPFVQTINGRRVTLASSGGHYLQNGYGAAISQTRSLAGRMPPGPGKKRGRPPKLT